MRYRILPLVCCVTVVLSLVASSQAVPFRVRWDPSVTGGSYHFANPKSDTPVTMPKGDQQKDFDGDLPDGEYRIVGAGFDFSMRVLNGKIGFSHGQPAGVKWDVSSNTLTFITTSIELDLGGYQLPVLIRDVTKVLDPAKPTQTFTLVPGHHQLLYGGGTLTLDIDANGEITLPDNPGGFSLRGKRVTMHPQPFAVKFGEGVSKCRVEIRNAAADLPTDVKLMPTNGGYALSITSNGKVEKLTLYMDYHGGVSSNPKGPFNPLTALVGADGSTLLTVVAPGGEEWAETQKKEQAAARALYTQVIQQPESTWHQDLVMSDAMNIYDFPEDTVGYAVTFPPNTVRAGQLSGVEMLTDQAVRKPIQLSDVEQSGEFLTRATVWFRASLPAGTTRKYRLLTLPADAAPGNAAGLRSEPAGKNQMRLVSDRLNVLVPAGRQEFAAGQPFAQAPAPIISLERVGGVKNLVAGRFAAPDVLRVTAIDAAVRESGPVRLVYSVKYSFDTARSYEVRLTLSNGDDQLLVDESIEGFAPEDEAYWQVDFAGLKPTRRQVMSNNGYGLYSGAYDRDIKRRKLPIELGIYTPNALGVMHAAAFWDEATQDGLLLATNRLRDWKTSVRRVWSSAGPENLCFYQDGQHQYFQTRLQGKERHWAMAAVPREAIVNRKIASGKGAPAGPEVRLWERLGDLNLNDWKDRVVDFDETLEPPACFKRMKQVSYEEWMSNYGLDAEFALLSTIINSHWDFSSTAGPVSFRDMPNWFGRYARSRSQWTPEQRRQVRGILLMMTYSAEDDNNVPHHSMLGGHPNFIMDQKSTVALACATFANHPDAKKWKASFLGYFDEWLNTYQRSDDPKHNARGGRWTENLVCYSGQALIGLMESQQALQSYDGTDLINSYPHITEWVRWYRDVMMPPQDGVRYAPPEGAHARSFEESGVPYSFRDNFFHVAKILGKSQPKLSAEIKWIETNGVAGQKPTAGSTLIVDHGAFLRYDLGGTNESYLHMQNIAGPLNYRWERAGQLYYGAKGKVWSYNLEEDNGDKFNPDRVTMFRGGGKGLKTSPTDQLLYDFDFVQFYKSPGIEPYLARAMMMVKDEYIAIFDEVAADATGEFVWANVFEMPQIYQVKPGAAMTEYTAVEPPPRPGKPAARKVTCRKYTGKGSFLTIVAPSALKAVATQYGASVNDQHVFLTAEAQDFTTGDLQFQGRSGYAARDHLALFDGTVLRMGKNTVRREGGDFGVSAVWMPDGVEGRIVGRDGGTVTLSIPDGIKTVSGDLAGEALKLEQAGNRVKFTITIAQKDGSKPFKITWR